MSLFFYPRAAGTATPAPPSTTPSFPPVPVLHARVAWRGDGFTRLAWGDLTDWISNGSGLSTSLDAFAQQDTFTFGGGTALSIRTQATATSGLDYAFGTAVFTQDRTYRFRVGLQGYSSTAATIRLGSAGDAATATATYGDGTWAWHTVDWTPSADSTAVYASIQNSPGDTVRTIRVDHAEVYEAFDEVSIDSLRVRRGSRFDGGAESPGSIEMTLLDGADEYTPRNTASPLYGLVEPGRELHVRATYNGRLYPVAFGVVDNIDPDPDQKKVYVSATDGLGLLEHYSITRPFATDTSYAAARAAVLADEALGTAQHALTTSGVESSNFADGTDASEKVLDYLDHLNEATGTLHVCAPSVIARYPWRYRTLDRAALTSDESGTFIDDDFQTLSGVDLRDETLLTRQRVSWVGYEFLPDQTIVEATEDLPYWQYTDEDYGSSDRPQPEAIFQVKRTRGRKRRRRKVRRRIGTRWVDAILPIGLDDAESKTTSVDFSVPIEGMALSFTDTNGYVSASSTATPALLDVTFSASGGSDTVTGMSVTGAPRIPLDEEEEVVTNGSVIREGSPIDNETIMSAGYASGLASYLTWRYGDARLRPEVVDQHFPVRQLTLDVGSHVTLTASRWFVSAVPFVVRAIEHTVEHGGLEWETEYRLEEVPAHDDWFTLGSSTLDGSAVLAY